MNVRIDDIVALLKERLDKAYRQGMEAERQILEGTDAYKLGYEQGHTDGLSEGYDDGYDNGHSDGYDKGWDDAQGEDE